MTKCRNDCIAPTFMASVPCLADGSLLTTTPWRVWCSECGAYVFGVGAAWTTEEDA